MYICMHVCIYVCVGVYGFVCVVANVCVRAYICTAIMSHVHLDFRLRNSQTMSYRQPACVREIVSGCGWAGGWVGGWVG